MSVELHTSSERKFSTMLKPIHFFLGVLVFIVSIGYSVISQKGDANLLLLASFGLLNMLLAPILPSWKCKNKQNLQNIVSLMVMAVAVLQAIFVLLSSDDTINGYDSSAFSVALLLAATIIHLMLHYKKQPKKARPAAAPAFAEGYQATESDQDREQGTVKWFNTAKGFGFISRDSGEDIFVHFRAIRGEGHRVLVEDERVEFCVVQREKGLQAEDVTIL